MVRKFIALGLVAGSLMIGGCNTVRGAGKDVKSAGQAVENVSK